MFWNKKVNEVEYVESVPKEEKPTYVVIDSNGTIWGEDLRFDHNGKTYRYEGVWAQTLKVKTYSFKQGAMVFFAPSYLDLGIWDLTSQTWAVRPRWAVPGEKPESTHNATIDMEAFESEFEE